MRRRRFLAGASMTAGLLGTGLGLGGCGSGPAEGARSPGGTSIPTGPEPGSRWNVLFLAIDDMNDWAGFLEPHPGTHTPNMDALAARSVIFERAYCSVPICLPSRAALLWGRSATTSGVYDHRAPSHEAYRGLKDDADPLMAAFRDAGYTTLGAGKISHDVLTDQWDDFHRTDFYVDGHVRNRENFAGRFDPAWVSPYDGRPIGDGSSFPGAQVDFGPSGVPSEEQPDGASAQWVRERLRQGTDRPFFLAYGVTQPHTPWRVPREFFDLHPLEDVVVPTYRPEDVEDLSDYVRGQIVDSAGSFRVIREAGVWEEAVQAYQAAISYADWCVGQVLDELAASPHADDTIVVLWSDHGFHLGEKLHWHKFTLWERATRVPFLLHVPGSLDAERRVDTPVSLLDLGPTLAEVCGLTLDPGHEGASLLPLLDDPSLGEDRPPITTWRPDNHSVRQGPYRYIRYETGDTELYDHRDDPEELHNLAGAAASRSVMDDLEGYLPVRS